MLRGAKHDQRRSYPPEGETLRRPCGPEEDSGIRASHWRGRLKDLMAEKRKCDRSLHFNREGHVRMTEEEEGIYKTSANEMHQQAHRHFSNQFALSLIDWTLTIEYLYLSQ